MPEPTPAQRLWQLWRRGLRPDVRGFLAGCGVATPAEVAAALLVDQRERWALGERVPAEAYLRLFPGLSQNLEYALELIYGEYLLCEERGEAVDPEAYFRRFPAHTARLKLQLDLHRALGTTGPALPTAAGV